MNTLTLSRNGASRTIPQGFSFTTLIFGGVPALIRGQWDYFFAVCLADALHFNFISFWIPFGDFGFVMWLMLFVLTRVWVGHQRNESLYASMLADGWLLTQRNRQPVELRGLWVDAANDSEN